MTFASHNPDKVENGAQHVILKFNTLDCCDAFGSTGMAYAITYGPEPDVINVTFIGRIAGKDLTEATSRCIALQKQTGVLRFLVEADGLEVVASYFEFYRLAYEQYSAEALNRLSRIAVILPTTLSARAAADFYKTVCQNAGWNAQVFASREKAIDWLTRSIDANYVT